MNKKIKEYLTDWKTRSPENVIKEVLTLSNETWNKVEQRDELTKGEVNEILDCLERCAAFFHYVAPLVEPIVSCRLDEVKLVGKNTYNELASLNSHVRELVHMVNNLTPLASIVGDMHEKHLIKYKDPYQ
jgi:hypothetical protein